MTKRRMGTCPRRTYWTSEGIYLIESYQARHQLASFSVTAETLVRLGLEQSPTEIITPIIYSAVHQAVHRELDRLVHLQLKAALAAELGWRFAAMSARDIGRVKQDPPERYQAAKAELITEAQRSLTRSRIQTLIAELGEVDNAAGDPES